MAKRRILNEIRIDKIAAVDKPCQEGATATIIKRAPSTVPEALVKRWIDPAEGATAFGTFLTETLRSERYWDRVKLYEPQVNALERSVTSVLGDGDLDSTAKGVLLREAVEAFLASVSGTWPEVVKVFNDATQTKEGTMPKTLEEQVAELTKSVSDLTAERDAAVAKAAEADAIAKMSDREKAHWGKEKDDKKKKDFMKADAATRKAIMDAAEAADETLTNADGTVVHKSAVGDAVFAMLKSQNEQIATMKAARDADAAALVKAKHRADAETMFKNLPGTVDERTDMVAALAGIADEATRKRVTDILKAHDALVAKGMVTIGTSDPGNPPSDRATAKAEFNAKVEEIAKAENLPRHEAMSKAVQQHPELYEAMNAKAA